MDQACKLMEYVKSANQRSPRKHALDAPTGPKQHCTELPQKPLQLGECPYQSLWYQEGKSESEATTQSEATQSVAAQVLAPRLNSYSRCSIAEHKAWNLQINSRCLGKWREVRAVHVPFTGQTGQIPSTHMVG